MLSSNPNAFVRRFTQPGVILVAIALTGAMGLIGGFTQLRSQIIDPFKLNKAANPAAANSLTADTDGDGLTDAAEQQAYGTSAFVPDSDSDGVSDGAEVAAGTDPRCTAGTVCTAWEASGSAATSTPLAITPTASTTAPTTNLTPQQLRDLLIQGGVPAEQVNSLTDAQLQEAWAAAVAQASNP